MEENAKQSQVAHILSIFYLLKCRSSVNQMEISTWYLSDLVFIPVAL